jgi:hypothetical protein
VASAEPQALAAVVVVRAQVPVGRAEQLPHV